MNLEAYFFWTGISGVIGALIGYGREQTVSGFILGFLLGPIGWIVTLYSLGNRRICPACSKKIPRNYANCPLCHSPLDSPLAKRSNLSNFGCLISLLFILGGIGGLIWFLQRAPSPPVVLQAIAPLIHASPTPKHHHRTNHPHGD